MGDKSRKQAKTVQQVEAAQAKNQRRKAQHTKERAERRAVAEKRNEAYRSLTIDQRIELVKSRPGNSKRELSRLLKQKAEYETKLGDSHELVKKS